MPLKFEITVGDLISAATFLIAAIGLFFNWWQLRIAGIQKRAEFIVSVFNAYVTDPACAEIFYAIEYGNFKYDSQFHKSDAERQLDRLLSYFEKIAALYEMGIVTRRDLDLVTYEFVRVYHNEGVQQYFATLDTLPEVVGVCGGTFERYRRVAAVLNAEQPWRGPDPPWTGRLDTLKSQDAGA